MKTKEDICYICTGGLGPPHVCCLVGGSISVSPHRPRLVDCRSSCGIPVPSGSLNPSPHSSTRFSELCLMFDVGFCICFHQLLSKASQRKVILGFYIEGNHERSQYAAAPCHTEELRSSVIVASSSAFWEAASPVSLNFYAEVYLHLQHKFYLLFFLNMRIQFFAVNINFNISLYFGKHRIKIT